MAGKLKEKNKKLWFSRGWIRSDLCYHAIGIQASRCRDKDKGQEQEQGQVKTGQEQEMEQMMRILLLQLQLYTVAPRMVPINSNFFIFHFTL
jgi:hypothetical protein